MEIRVLNEHNFLLRILQQARKEVEEAPISKHDPIGPQIVAELIRMCARVLVDIMGEYAMEKVENVSNLLKGHIAQYAQLDILNKDGRND